MMWEVEVWSGGRVEESRGIVLRLTSFKPVTRPGDESLARRGANEAPAADRLGGRGGFEEEGECIVGAGSQVRVNLSCLVSGVK